MRFRTIHVLSGFQNNDPAGPVAFGRMIGHGTRQRLGPGDRIPRRKRPAIRRQDAAETRPLYSGHARRQSAHNRVLLRRQLAARGEGRLSVRRRSLRLTRLDYGHPRL